MAFGKGKKSGGKSSAFGKSHGAQGGSLTRKHGSGKTGVLTATNMKVMGSKAGS